MSGFLHRVVAIAAVELELPRVQFVTKWNRLFRLMTDVNDVRMDGGEQTSRQIPTDGQSDQHDENRKFVYPCRKMKLLHSIHPQQDLLNERKKGPQNSKKNDDKTGFIR